MFELAIPLRAFFDSLRTQLVGLGFTPLEAWASSKLIQTSVTVACVLSVPLILVYGERKISAFMQARIGPMETGPWGILQTLADGLKLFFKEDVIPNGADRLMHTLSVIIAVAPVFVCFAPIPFGKDLAVVPLDTGILFVFAASGLSTIGIVCAGWASANKFSILGGIRAAAQMVSYEIPRVLSVVPVIMLASTLNLSTIADAQAGGILHWFIAVPIIGQLAFIIFLISSVAETNRLPFDLPEAESELVSGFHTEFSGMKFALFFLAEYAYVFLSAALATTLFLGGGHGWSAGGWIPSWFWFLFKSCGIVLLFFWFRWTYPRLRVDRLMSFCWEFLLPLSLINIVLTAVWIVFKGMP